MEVFNTELRLEKKQHLNIGYFRGVMVYKPTWQHFKNRWGDDSECAKIVLFETSKNENTGWVSRTTFVGEVYTKGAIEDLKTINTQCILKIEYTLCNRKVGKTNGISINVLRIEKEFEFGDELIDNEKTY